MSPPAKVILFAARSGTGKTTLLEKLVPLLKFRDLKVAVIKHSHHDIEFDQPGKDSHRFQEAGADLVMINTPGKKVIFETFPLANEDLRPHLEPLRSAGFDFILVEGYRDQPWPKIELIRLDQGEAPLYKTDPHVIAVISDQPRDTALPRFDFSQTRELCDFLLKWRQTT